MAEVIDLDSRRPHDSGPAMCLECGYGWIAVAPSGMFNFECPQCRTHKGVWKGLYEPKAETVIFTCCCGGNFFWYIKGNRTMCVKCGAEEQHE